MVPQVGRDIGVHPGRTGGTEQRVAGPATDGDGLDSRVRIAGGNRMLNALLAKVIGTQNERELKRLYPRVAEISALEPHITPLTDEQLRQKTTEFKKRLEDGETLDDLLVEAFAVVREAGRRVLNMRHFDVQLIGGMVLHHGKIAEMRTGEGKTLVATLSCYLNALEGKGVHVVTVNDYLAKRDSEWMGRIYKFLGMSVGVIVHGLDDDERRAAYHCDITYGTNNEYGFDYLRDNMKFRLEDCTQRGFHYAIVDEVDSILIDEARTPLIISGPSEESTDKYYRIDRIIPKLIRGEVIEGKEPGEKYTTGDYTVDEKHRSVALTEEGVLKCERLLGIGVRARLAPAGVAPNPGVEGALHVRDRAAENDRVAIQPPRPRDRWEARRRIAPRIERHAPGLAQFSLTSKFFWIVVLATTGGLLLSLSSRVRALEGVGASTLGSVLLYVLIATIGMKMNILAVFDQPALFLVGAGAGVVLYHSAFGFTSAWRALIVDDPEELESPEVAVYCPACGEREFGPPTAAASSWTDQEVES